MNFTLIKSSGGTTYVLNSHLSICILNDNKLFYIYYKIKENLFAKSYFLKEEFLKNKIHSCDMSISNCNGHIFDFLKVNPEITNQIRKILKYHDIL